MNNNKIEELKNKIDVALVSVGQLSIRASFADLSDIDFNDLVDVVVELLTFNDLVDVVVELRTLIYELESEGK